MKDMNPEEQMVFLTKLENKWKKNKYIKIVVTLIDVKDIVHSKRSYSLRNRGASMKKLSDEMQKSQDKILVRNLTVPQFYEFYSFLKEVIPVMNLIAQKYQPDDFIEKKLSEIHRRNSARNKMMNESCNISHSAEGDPKKVKPEHIVKIAGKKS
jgi:hypothetical protein